MTWGGGTVPVPPLCTDSLEKKLWPSRQQGAVGQEEALSWQLFSLENYRSGSFCNPAWGSLAGMAPHVSRTGYVPFSDRCRSKGPRWGLGAATAVLDLEDSLLSCVSRK